MLMKFDLKRVVALTPRTSDKYPNYQGLHAALYWTMHFTLWLCAEIACSETQGDIKIFQF